VNNQLLWAASIAAGITFWKLSTHVNPDTNSRAESLARCKAQNQSRVNDPEFSKQWESNGRTAREIVRTECTQSDTKDPGVKAFLGSIVWLEKPADGSDPKVEKVLTSVTTFPAD
jgi:hypothetical protein